VGTVQQIAEGVIVPWRWQLVQRASGPDSARYAALVAVQVAGWREKEVQLRNDLDIMIAYG